jgi:hypothetical protein
VPDAKGGVCHTQGCEYHFHLPILHRQESDGKAIVMPLGRAKRVSGTKQVRTSRPYATSGRIAGMDIALVIFGVAFSAFCVWLGVRIINRRERWAKRMAVGLAVLSVLYVFSSGPMRYAAVSRHTSFKEDAAGRVSKTRIVELSEWWFTAYAPIDWASRQPWGKSVIWWYLGLFPVFVDVP